MIEKKLKLKLKINKIYLGVDKKNLHAIKAFKKNGFTKENLFFKKIKKIKLYFQKKIY